MVINAQRTKQLNKICASDKRRERKNTADVLSFSVHSNVRVDKNTYHLSAHTLTLTHRRQTVNGRFSIRRWLRWRPTTLHTVRSAPANIQNVNDVKCG